MKRTVLLVLPALIAVAGCSSMPKLTSWLTPYRIDVRQGNYVTQEMVAQLKLGQSRDQVRFILGTPLLADPYHADRWDYVYRFQPGQGEAQQRRMTVYFADGKLSRIDGDAMPPAAAGKSPAQAAVRVVEIAPATAAKDQGKTAPEVQKPAPTSN
ncbi:MAG: outer membrane protein assembly factor BamE [Sterolibacterium sp.]